MSSLVIRENVGEVAILTLNRPDKLNALSPHLFGELRGHVDTLARETEQFGCVVINGAGRSFCAGADVEALKAGTVTDDPEFRSETIERIGSLPQAVIASVHGHCYTGGLELATAADLIVAADSTRFCDTHAKLGIVPRWGLSARLPRRVGLATAKRLSLTCEPVEAQEALAIGLCDYVVPADQLRDFTLERASRIAANARNSVTEIKHLYEKALSMPLEEALAYEREFTKPGETKMR